MAGEVYVEKERVTKPDKKVEEDALIEVRGDPIPYVSYGGIKLEAALRAFGMDVAGKKALDIGSSTGGFVDCLLKHGARTVYAIDAGTHQLHERLRNDDRVVLSENYNARNLVFEDIGEQVDLATIDVSFISLTKILGPVLPLIKPGGCIMSLLKPQFEVGRYEVGKRRHREGRKEDRPGYGSDKGLRRDPGTRGREFGGSAKGRERKNKEYFILWEIRTCPNRSSISPA